MCPALAQWQGTGAYSHRDSGLWAPAALSSHRLVTMSPAEEHKCRFAHAGPWEPGGGLR